MFTDLVLSFDNEDSTRNRLTSTLKLKETLFDVHCVKLIEFSPRTTSPFIISLDSAQGESNTYFGNVIALSTGRNVCEFPTARVVKTNIDVVTCKMTNLNFAPINSSRRAYARVHLRIFHGLPKKEMKQRSFLLTLNRSIDRKLMEVDYKLEDPIHDATSIRVHSWYSGSGYQFVSCPLVKPTTETNANDADAHLIAFGLNSSMRDYGTHPIRTSHRTVNTIPISIAGLQGARQSRSYALIHLTIYHD